MMTKLSLAILLGAALLGSEAVPGAASLLKPLVPAARAATTASTTCSSGPCTGFSGSGLDGGSYVRTVAVDPAGNGVVLAGSDVGGVYRSTNDGVTWVAANQGITVGSLSVASLAFSPSVAGKAYAALGNNGPGGVEASTDDGQTWSLRSSVPQFNGPNSYTGARASGRTVAVASDGTLYAATTNMGLARSTDDGSTWVSIGLTSPVGAVPRGVAVDPSNPNVVYVANYGAGNLSYPSGLYETINAEASQPLLVPVPGAPADVEDLSFVGETLYVAASSSGVFATPDGGASWSQLIGPGPGLWASVTGYLPSGGSAAVLYAGQAHPTADPAGGYVSVVKSTDGGATWASVTPGGAGVHTTEGGPTGPTWWFASFQPSLLIGGGSYIPRQIVVDPSDTSRVIVAGNADIWSSADGASNWYPMTRGLSTTVERGVVSDSNSAGYRYAVGYDWGIVGSTDGMKHVTDVTPANVTGSFDVALDRSSTPSTVYLAGFSEFSPATTADVYVNHNPLAGAAWASTGLAAATGGEPILGVSVNHLGTGSKAQTVVLAAVGATPGTSCTAACGIWRKGGTGPWVQVQTAAMSKPEGGFHASFGWLYGSQIAYLYDPATGLWRSNNAGSTWTEIWAAPYNHDLTGFIGVASGSSTVYLSVGTSGVWKLTNAQSMTVGTGITAGVVGNFSGAGPLTVAPDGSIWVAQVAPYGSGLWRSTDGGGTWTAVGDSSYASMADFPTGVSVAPSGQVLVSTRGDGVAITG